ncbi:MAG: response regulator [Magnetococcales bacterium]|nr:response regulator [Magnetococcales bacterium]
MPLSESNTVILADSRPDALDSLTSMAGVRFRFVAVHEEAQLFRELARSTGSNIVILDVAVVSIPALDLCRQFRRLQTDNTILILTSYQPDPALERQAVECGADDFFFLPMHPELFHRRLERFDAGIQALSLSPQAGARDDFRQGQIFESLVEFGVNPLVIFDQDGVIIRFNHQAELLFGASARNTRGKNIMQWLAPESHAAFLEAVQIVCSRVNPSPRFVKKISITGMDFLQHRIALEFALSAVVMEHRVLLVASLHDISGQKEAHRILSESLSLAERRILKEQKELERVRQAERNATISLRMQQTINDLLHISLETGSLQEKLQRSLERINQTLNNCSDSLIGMYLYEQHSAQFSLVSSIPDGALPPQWSCPHATVDCTSCLISPNFTDSLTSVMGDNLKGKVDYCLPYSSDHHLIGALRMIVPEHDISCIFENAIFDSIGKVLVYIIIRARIDQALLESQERAEAANRAKSEFLANMSHEIRSPLNAIIGMTDLVLSTSLSREEMLGNLEIVHSSSLSLLDLINGILDLSKIEAGHFQLEHIAFDLLGQLEGACEMLAIKAHRKGLSLYNRIPSNLPHALEGDPVRLKQIIVNLINNAIKFTSSGEIVLTVEPINPPESDPMQSLWLRFSVIDTGIGIPEELQNKIFQSFVQADGSIARKYGGTGLGLTISRHLVEMMGGTLQVESRKGEGSHFFFTIPFAIARQNGPLEPWMKPRRHDEAKARHAQLQGRRILLVDEHPTGAEIVESLLCDHGALVTRADSRDAFLEQMERQIADPFDLLLVDEMVIQGCDCLARDPYMHYQSRIIVMVSAHLTSQNFVLEGVLKKVVIIKKPVRQYLLLKRIARLLTPHSAQSEEDELAASSRSIPKAEQPLHILLVEDLVANQKLAKDILTLQGHRVTIANNGVEALDRLHGGSRFDLILMDLQMPIMDGFETTRRIRGGDPAEIGNPQVPIIAVSAMVMMNEKKKCYEIGMNGFLLKPYQTHELIQAVADFAKIRKPPTPKPVVKEVVLTSVDTDEETLRRFKQNFILEVPNHMRQLHQSLLQSDLGSVLREGSWLRSIAGNIGANRLASHAIRLTGQAEMDAWDDALIMYPNLEQYVESLVQRLTQEGVA